MAFIKHCPCSPQTVSCGYYNINLHTGCPYDCSYCILQLYLPDKNAHFIPSLDEAETELRAVAETLPELRIGTGELADSLADPQTDLLLPFMFRMTQELPRVVLELKTKSDRVEALLKRPAQPNIVVAWSLNPEEIVNQEETGTASLGQRLEALRKTAQHGYKVAIHFDPLILAPNWQQLYRELCERIFRILPIDRLAWWSLGALRFPSGLRRHIFRHADSRLFEGELIRGYDEKYRYLRPLREELFLTLRSCIEPELGSADPLYLCMEDEEMWRRVFPELPAETGAINRRLHRRVIT